MVSEAASRGFYEMDGKDGDEERGSAEREEDEEDGRVGYALGAV